MSEGQHGGSFRYATSIAITVVALALVGFGVLSLLPQHVDPSSPLKTLDDLASAYLRVHPGETRASQLGALGFDTTSSNVHVLSYLGLIERYTNSDSRKFDTLDTALQDCIESRDRCTGFVFQPADQAPRRNGVLASLGLGAASAADDGAEVMIIVRNGRVAYKAMVGMPASVMSRVATQSPVRAVIPTETATYRSVE
jgi:hypothetical protein